MTLDVVSNPRAKVDDTDIYRHSHEEAGRPTADRFLASVAPGIGTPYEVESSGRIELRVARLSGRFKAYLVFYRSLSHAVVVVRILHGSRDVASILAEEF